MPDTNIYTEMLAAAGVTAEQTAVLAVGHRGSEHQRNGDRGDGDGPSSRLPVFIRYRDLLAAGIVGSYNQLLRYIDHEGFPIGRMLSPNIRAWTVQEVRKWLDARPTARKIPPPLTDPINKPRGRKRKAA
jgi:predicted DNA-binding transcriptional regulator AlpA